MSEGSGFVKVNSERCRSEHSSFGISDDIWQRTVPATGIEEASLDQRPASLRVTRLEKGNVLWVLRQELGQSQIGGSNGYSHYILDRSCGAYKVYRDYLSSQFRTPHLKLEGQQGDDVPKNRRGESGARALDSRAVRPMPRATSAPGSATSFSNPHSPHSPFPSPTPSPQARAAATPAPS